MGTVRIEDLQVGGTDAAGNEIVCIYVQRPPEYAVYHTGSRVMIQFADDKATARLQTAKLAPLNALRGQISGLIDGWRSDGASADPNAPLWKRVLTASKQQRLERDHARAVRYDRRVADALIMALEEGIADALALLAEIRDNIVAERKSFAQTDYLLTAAAAGIMLLIVIAILANPAFNMFPHPPVNANIIFTAAGAGVLGAFFSIATGFRSRTILVDLQKWDNRRDALLRIVVGTIGAGIVLSLLLAGMVALAGMNAETFRTRDANTDPILLALVFGFLAGFSERFVGDLLGRVSLAVTDEHKSDVAGEQAKAAAVTAAVQTNAASTAAAATAEDSDSDDQDACCGVAAGAGQVLTKDEDLPITVGGVSTNVLPPVPPAAGAAKPKADPVDAE